MHQTSVRRPPATLRRAAVGAALAALAVPVGASAAVGSAHVARTDAAGGVVGLARAARILHAANPGANVVRFRITGSLTGQLVTLIFPRGTRIIQSVSDTSSPNAFVAFGGGDPYTNDARQVFVGNSQNRSGAIRVNLLFSLTTPSGSVAGTANLPSGVTVTAALGGSDSPPTTPITGGAFNLGRQR